MSKFNFQNYQENLSDKQLKMGAFKPIQPGGFGSSRRDSKPIVGVSHNGITFNSVSTQDVTSYGKYVEFMIHGEFLVMRFLNKKSDASYSLNVGKNESSGNTGAGAVIKALQENTDLVNLNIYRYRFELANDEENIFFIDMSKPYSKSRIK